MKTSDFDYELPQELIAQVPISSRSESRLLVLNRNDGSIQHQTFTDIVEFFTPGDVLVFNNSRVIPARIKGVRADTGGKVEILLLRKTEDGQWHALVKPGRAFKEKTVVTIVDEGSNRNLTAEITGITDGGIRVIRFPDESFLHDMGEIPLPPYIHEPLKNPERYQTVYARPEGSAAAPTAGLHFTDELLDAIRSKGVETLFTTLHIGLDTFRPVKEDDPAEHVIHREFGIVDASTATAIRSAKREGRRVICVGTTSVRITEAAATGENEVIQPFEGWVQLYILPGYSFKIADAMITNFHLPKSTLIMMVSAFAGTENIRKAYREAIEQRYRFYSFGDAMLIQ